MVHWLFCAAIVTISDVFSFIVRYSFTYVPIVSILNGDQG